MNAHTGREPVFPFHHTPAMAAQTAVNHTARNEGHLAPPAFPRLAEVKHVSPAALSCLMVSAYLTYYNEIYCIHALNTALRRQHHGDTDSRSCRLLSRFKSAVLNFTQHGAAPSHVLQDPVPCT